MDVTASDLPRFSWLTNLRWISRAELAPSASTAQLDDIAIRTEIGHIGKQLLQVKRRLGPAAERCVEAFSSYHCGDLRTTSRVMFGEARRACNPLEVALGVGPCDGLPNFFINRSAIKLANIDAALGFCLTLPDTGDNLVFVDICGAPGGFSEYILWRCQLAGLPVCRGFGMSLKGPNEYGQGIDWKIQDLFHDDKSMRGQYQICHGDDGTGDILQWENVESLQQTIYSSASTQEASMSIDEDRGRVHLVLADGGFDAQRDSDNQEEVAQKLVVCEAAAALTLLRRGGILVIKLFGFQTAVVRTVMRHFFFVFENIVAVKPISSRPASAERYVVCSGFKGNAPGWDGRRWCDQMYLSRPCLLTDYSASVDYEHAELYLFRYLDDFDRDLGTLNLKACFAILSYLETKCMELTQAPCDEEWVDLSQEMHRINIAFYKIAWRLSWSRQ